MTKKEKRDYARVYQQEQKAKQRQRYEANHLEDAELSKLLGAKLCYPKIQNAKKERKLQEKITQIWRQTGEFVIPDEKIIKEVYKELEKEALLYEDTVEDVDIKDCEVNFEEDLHDFIYKEKNEPYDTDAD